MSKEKNKLFSDFPPVSTEQWEEKIKGDLKGADYEKKLVWNTVEGIKIRPYYRLEDNKKLEQIDALPSEYPFLRGKYHESNDWRVRQDFEEKGAAEANKAALNAIEKGAEEVAFNVTGISENHELENMINGIDTDTTAVSFIHALNYKTLLKEFLEVLSKTNRNSNKLKGSFNFDPIGYFVLYGTFFDSEEDNFNDAADLINSGDENIPLYKIININGQHFHEAGASIVQEIAFSLAQANEYLANLTDKNIPVDKIADKMQFTVSIGSSYFMEIAKIRALRMLWANIVKQYNPSSEKSCKTSIHAVTSNWNKTIYDPYVNLLRSTTEIMAAAIGGIDSMTVNPFDATFKKPDEFSKRLARNQQTVIKHEAYFNKVVDPAAGSYYIEQLTNSIANEAWELFRKIESEGGFIKVAKDGFINSEIEKTCQKRDMNIAQRKQVFVGTNQYPNSEEEVIDKIEPTAKLSDLGGLKPYRGAYAFEAIRMATENHKKKGFDIPKVFLFKYGNAAMSNARAGFSISFFGCVGYEIINNPKYNDIDKGAKEAINNNPNIVVLCSSDEEYEELSKAAKIIKDKNKDAIIIVAGYPKDSINKLQENGVDDFIHVKTNILDKLTLYNEKFDIN